jgi:hypothetical protein
MPRSGAVTLFDLFSPRALSLGPAYTIFFPRDCDDRHELPFEARPFDLSGRIAFFSQGVFDVSDARCGQIWRSEKLALWLKA